MDIQSVRKMNELQKFILKDTYIKNAWVVYDDMDIYLRRTIRFYNQEILNITEFNCLDLATVQMEDHFQHQGRFKRLLTYLIEINPYPLLYIENVLNTDLYHYLKTRIDFIEIDNSLCFINRKISNVNN